jgi:formylglycine-generating enzyme required for sulfatase activity
MGMRASRIFIIVAIATCRLSPLAQASVVFDWTPIGNAGNAADPITGFGSVTYAYQISRCEVTNSQYVEFLSAKAASDPLGLYNTNMSSNVRGGINRSGSSGSYSYSVKSGYANMPVVFVGWYDAIRFANWLHNGQGSGNTESGAYTLNGGTPIPNNGSTLTRNPGATIFLPSDEWYKAAYQQPSSASGDTDNYWLYPTRTNSEPNSDQPPGDAAIWSNVANFFRDDGLTNGYNDGYAVTGDISQNHLTNVGAYVNSPSYYGTFDQGGNVEEWNQAISGSIRGLRGGTWGSNSPGLQADFRGGGGDATFEDHKIGFRLASIPEPSALALLALEALTLLRQRRARGHSGVHPARPHIRC